MYELSLFKNMSQTEIENMIKALGIRRISFEKGNLIFSKLVDDDLIGIIIDGTANIINYDYKGNINVIDKLEYDSLFCKRLLNFNNEISVIATSYCEVIFIDYSVLFQHQDLYYKICNNISSMLVNKINILYERLEILSKRTIREKLLCYFNLIAIKKENKSFSIPLTYMELADYLAIDRSAMMREIKTMKSLGIIMVSEKRITLLNKEKI